MFQQQLPDFLITQARNKLAHRFRCQVFRKRDSRFTGFPDLTQWYCLCGGGEKPDHGPQENHNGTHCPEHFDVLPTGAFGW